MMKQAAAWLLVICLAVCLTPAARAAEPLTECVFDGLVVRYPDRLSIFERDLGLFLYDGASQEFIQFNTGPFPEDHLLTVEDIVSSGAIENLKQSDFGYGFSYTSGAEIIPIGGRDWIHLKGARGNSPFYQYITMAGSTLLICTVKGDGCNADAPAVLASLRSAGPDDLYKARYSGNHEAARITRPDAQGGEELVGFSSPVIPIAYSAFEQGFLDTLKKLAQVEQPRFSVSRCYYSDGQYVRIIRGGQATSRVYTAGPSETDQFTGLYFTTSNRKDDPVYPTTAILVAAYSAFGQMRDETFDRIQTLYDTGVPENANGAAFWTENGYESMLGQTAREGFARIRYTGTLPDVPVKALPDPSSDSLPVINRPGLTLNRFLKRFNAMVTMLTLKPSQAELPDGQGTVLEDGAFLLSISLDGPAVLKLWLKDESDDAPVTRIGIECPADASGGFDPACLAALFASTELTPEEMIDVLEIADDSAPMAVQLCGRHPYTCVDGVALDAVCTDSGLIAALYGFEP